MAEDQAPESQIPPSRDVFISYASQDAAVAHAIVEALEAHGIKCWIAPRDVTPGAHYADAIILAISGAKCVVLVLSDSALVSKHVGKEIERASSKGRPIIALRTGAAPLPPAFEYFLSESQWIEAQSGSMQAAYAKLVEAIRESAPTNMPAATPATPVGKASALQSKSRRNRILLAAGLAVVAVTLAALWAGNFWPAKQVTAEQPTTAATTAVSDKSIAVLPFVNMSSDKEQEYFSDGLSEELLNLLAQVPDLKVIARTSSFAFKGKEANIAEIAKILNVAHVVEGSVRKSGNKLRITAQLVRTADSTHLWSETYDRPLDDIFAVQDEIANAIVQALQIQLAGGELSRRKGGTQNLEAYQLYLRAVSAHNQNTRSSIDAEGEYLEQAIKLDPNYGRAWSGLALNVNSKTDNGVLDPNVGYPRVRQLAQHALQLSPDLAAETHSWLQYVHLVWDWDWDAAEAEGRRALAIDPTNPFVLRGAGILARTLGRWDESERYLLAALVRDPLDPYAIWNLGFTYYGAGRFAEAESTYRKLLEIAPDFLWTRGYLGKTLLMQGKPEAALAMVQQEADEVERQAYLAVMLQAVGRQVEADEALQAQIAQWADTGAFSVAQTYAYRGDHERALEWLERAYQQKDAALIEIVGEHMFKGMAGDPRFKAFLRKMKLPG